MTAIAPTPTKHRTTATARLARLIAVIRRRTTRQQTNDRPRQHSLDMGPVILPEADRYAPTWQDDMPFFLQPGYGHDTED